ncbi:hypothetical protein GSI_08147 [Ganoderma sinense ZZ0214-1]|uniref:DASH complex subunit DAD4 n=1 Tax=Ganoderma sinense ZZ0214-1 TaxID=1077348 RepID=A0A2G8S7F8_9APHY|nr:hypothetical protein GSI_08147 [Ganoderma sinense ZZ0214-1]
MENPHAERQNVLIQRIIKNADKCTEAIIELNRCLEARLSFSESLIYLATDGQRPLEIIQADTHVKTAADLVTKYRKNVQYNLDATRTAAAQSE